MTNTDGARKGVPKWVWALLGAAILIALVVFLMNQGSHGDLDRGGPRPDTADAPVGAVTQAPGGMTSADGIPGTAPAEADSTPGGGATGNSATGDAPGDTSPG